MSEFAIETHHLRKEYGDKLAVADLSLSVYTGEVFGFIGPNGAGKTTSIKMLLGLISPTAGTGTLLGRPVGDIYVRAHIGFLPEHFRFHEWLTAVEFLQFHADLAYIPREVSDQRIPEMLDLVGLTASREKQLKSFSKGMLQRIGLAQALLNKPELVFLDEPTSGLDPMGRRMVRDIMQRLRQEGTTVFLNSHYLSEVEITCDRVAFIREGIVVRTDSIHDLMATELLVEIQASNLSQETINGLEKWGSQIQVEGGRLTLVLPDRDLLPQVNRYLVESGAEIYTFRPKEQSLEELFIQIIRGEGRGSFE